MRAVTSVAVKEARLKEIKTELLNSSKLKVFPYPPHPQYILHQDLHSKF